MAALVRTMLAEKNGEIRLCEVHDRASPELVRDSTVDNGQSFDGVWISGLTQTTSLGIPDTELISPLQRALLMTPVPKPLQENGRSLCAAFDADSGGAVEDIPALTSVLAMNGISMIIVEDKAMTKPGEKVNSLLATSNAQGQADMYAFANIFIYANHLMRARIQGAADALEGALAEKPDLFVDDDMLRASLTERNYGCLLRQLAERRQLGQSEGSEAHRYGIAAEWKAVENMRATVKDLAGGQLSGCEADHRIITVKELLKINAHQVSPV